MSGDLKGIQRRIEALKQEIREHDRRYYVLSDPQITDQEYDALVGELNALETQYPQFRTSDSPTQRVSGSVNPREGVKVVSHEKMLSLDNTYSIDELLGWEKKILKLTGGIPVDYMVELKIDGVSASLLFREGKFTLGATRGDGRMGEDITENIKTIRGFPILLLGQYPEELEVRAEIYLDKKEFQAMNKAKQEKGGEIFANARNAASGSLKLLDPEEVRRRRLKYFVHSLGFCRGFDFVSQEQFLKKAQQWGFVVNQTCCHCNDLQEVIVFCRQWQDRRNDLPYEVDGMVVKVNAVKTQQLLGSTMKSPRWAVAYKFPGQQVITEVEDILIQVGRTGVLTPVAVLKPVACAGVTISRATLHNFDEIKRLGIQKYDQVLVERAGEVIPKIVKVMGHTRQARESVITIPRQCPVCTGTIVKDAEEVALRCINPDCPAQIEQSLLHFASRQAMDIQGLGEAVVKEMVQKHMVKSLVDLYTLQPQQLLSIPLFAHKKAGKLIAAIAASKTQPLHRFLFGLGIRHIGQKAALSLSEAFTRIELFFSLRKDEILQIRDIGEVAADSVIDFFRQEHIGRLIRDFKKAGLSMEEEVRNVKVNTAELQGKKIVFTGALMRLSRAQAQEKARKAGAEIMDSVSKNTDIVVAGENAGSKLQKARDLHVRIIDEAAFLKIIGEGEENV